jgi:hypothetical protein
MDAEASLLGAMIEASPYRRFLRDIADDAVRIALANNQIRPILSRVAASGRVPSAGWLGRRRADADERILLAFLEHLAFASPKFLASVGEWPLREHRG